MASKTSTGSARTAPKGQATRSQSKGAGRDSFITPAMQWFLVVIVALVVLGGIFYLGRDVRSNLGGGGGHSGAPAPAAVVIAPTA